MKNFWKNNKIQFARFIAEAEYFGCFNKSKLRYMAESMDLQVKDLHEIINRACDEFDKIKQKL